MLKKIFRRVRKAAKDIGSFASDNPLAVIAGLGLGFGSECCQVVQNLD